MFLRTVHCLILTIGVPSVAIAQSSSAFEISLSTLEWWAVAGAFLIGLLMLISRRSAARDQAISSGHELGRENAGNRSEADYLYKPSRLHVLDIYGLIGLASGIASWLLSLLPAAFALGGAAVLLFTLALSLFDVVRFNFFGIQLREQFNANRRFGMIVALFLAAMTSFIFYVLFETDGVGSDLQLIAGIVGALVLGVVFGDILLTTSIPIALTAPQAKTLRRFVGVALIALAIYVTGRIPQVPVMFIWSAFLIVLAVYGGATSKLGPSATSWEQLRKGGGIVILIFGAIGIASASFGHRNLSEPVSFVSALVTSGGALRTNNQAASTNSSVFTYVASMDEFNQLITEAKQANQSVLVDYYAEWCLDCKRMDRTTFKDPSVIAMLEESFESIKVDVSDPNDEFSRAIRKRYQVFGPPAMLFFDSRGNLSSSSPAYGYLDVEELTDLLAEML